MVDVLKGIANDKRIKILYCLTLGDLCQVHISEITGIIQVDVSRNAKILIDLNIIEAKKNKNRVIYSINKDFQERYDDLIRQIESEYSYLTKNYDLDELLNRCQNY